MDEDIDGIHMISPYFVHSSSPRNSLQTCEDDAVESSFQRSPSSEIAAPAVWLKKLLGLEGASVPRDQFFQMVSLFRANNPWCFHENFELVSAGQSAGIHVPLYIMNL